MLLEELYNQDYKDKAEAAYYATLNFWLTYNDTSIYEDMLEYYKEKEQYELCEGIDKAIDKIYDVMDSRFEESQPVDETDEEVLLSMEEHARISRLIFKDILKEIYERQVKRS